MSDFKQHNEDAKEIVGIISRVDSMEGMMVLTESTIVGVMLLLNRLYGFPPRGCVGMMETCLQQATVRFAEQMNKEGER